MTRFFQQWGLERLFAEVPRAVLARVEEPVFIAQCAAILVTGLAAFWFGRLAHPALTRLGHRTVPRNWAPGFVRASKSLAPPLFWLAMLWLADAGCGLFGIEQPLIGAAEDLLLAWICIRLLSLTVKSSLASVTISVVAWSIAALMVLHLLGPLTAYLGHVNVYYRDAGHRISLLDAVDATIVLAALLWLTSVLFRFLRRLITRSQSLTPSLQVLLVQLLQIFLPAAAIIVALQTVGINLTALTVTFGAFGLGVGLGLQRVVSNLVAGLTLLVGKTIKPGDIVEYKNSYGWVTAMGARYVTLRTRDGVEHLVPNDYFLENGVENWSYSDVKLRLHVPVGISYDSDVHQAIALCIEAAKAVGRVIPHPEPICLLREFGDSSINLEIRFWIEDPRNGTTNVKSEVLLEVWDRFKAAGITIPFARRDVRILSMPRPEAPP